MKRPTRTYPEWRDPVLHPDTPLPAPEEVTGSWAMDPFMGCEFMSAPHGSDSAPEVFGRSISDTIEEPQAGPIVEPDAAITGNRHQPAPHEGEGEVRPTTMWMRIEEETRRRARDAGASSEAPTASDDG